MKTENFTFENFTAHKIVPRETFLRLQRYVELLEKWQKTINLVSSNTLSDVWNRHVIDSTQLIEHIAPDDHIVDVGSGAGFPGMVLAILGCNVTLVESDSRKATFLQEVARTTQTKVVVVNQLIEKVSLREFTVVTARAFASIDKLLNLLGNRLEYRHKLLLLKGKSHISEIEAATREWNFDFTVTPSATDKESAIVTIKHIQQGARIL